MDVLSRMAAAGVVPVVVLDKAEDAVPTARAMIASGSESGSPLSKRENSSGSNRTAILTASAIPFAVWRSESDESVSGSINTPFG